MSSHGVGVLFALQIGCASLGLIGVAWVWLICIRGGKYGQLAACYFVPFYLYYWLFWVVTDDDCSDVEALRWIAALPNTAGTFLGILIVALRLGGVG